MKIKSYPTPFIILLFIRICLGALLFKGVCFVFFPNELNQFIAKIDFFDISYLFNWHTNGAEWGNIKSLIVANFYIYFILLLVFNLITYGLNNRF